MKIRNIFTGLGLIALLTSCEEMLDYNEVVSYNKEEIFSSFDRTGRFVTNIYAKMEDGLTSTYGRGATLASACDEAEFAWSSSNIHNFSNGAWSENNTMSSTWSNSYNGIRAVNFFLEASEGETFEQFRYNKDYNEQMERFNRYQYEVRFLRAYFYFNLVREFGDVPFVSTVLSEAEANSVSRSSAKTIFDFIISECDEIVDELPVSYSSMSYSETGRITRLTVLALKGRAALYAASPLFNSSGDNSLWRVAADANKAVIDSCAKYGATLNKYTDLWGTNNYANTEVIMVKRLGDSNTFEYNNFPMGVEGGNSGNCPTQTLVDAYQMKATGKYWNEEGSGYNQESPFTGRDPRFAMTVAFNGVEGWPTYNAFPLEIFEGGRNASPLPGATPSGYYLRKYCDVSVDLRPNYTNSKRHSWIIYRLGEFYLNYAEAAYRYFGSAESSDEKLDITALEAVNVIRSRSDVGMPAITAADFEQKLMNERMVELAFENHRFWDLRRWKKGELLESVKLLNITRDASSGVLSYKTVVKNRSWDDKMYLFPIAASEIRKNTNLTQNPGWGR